MKIPRLSEKERVILRLLRTGRQMYGLELVKSSDDQLARGTVYVTLQRMEEKGLVTSEQEETVDPRLGFPRRLYKVTALGERTLEALEQAVALMALAESEVGA